MLGYLQRRKIERVTIGGGGGGKLYLPPLLWLQYGTKIYVLPWKQNIFSINMQK
jgi:hypothetical protein